MVPQNSRICIEDLLHHRNSAGSTGGASSHAPPSLAARGFMRRRGKHSTRGGRLLPLILSSPAVTCKANLNTQQAIDFNLCFLVSFLDLFFFFLFAGLFSSFAGCRSGDGLWACRWLETADGSGGGCWVGLHFCWLQRRMALLLLSASGGAAVKMEGSLSRGVAELATRRSAGGDRSCW